MATRMGSWDGSLLVGNKFKPKFKYDRVNEKFLMIQIGSDRA